MTNRLRTITLLVVSCPLILALSACGSTEETLGAGAGGVAGGAVGHKLGGTPGAIGGAAAGALIGGEVGEEFED